MNNIRCRLRLMFDVLREKKIGDWTSHHSCSSALLSSPIHFRIRSRLSKLGQQLASLFSHCFLLDFVHTTMDELLFVHIAFVILFQRMAQNKSRSMDPSDASSTGISTDYNINGLQRYSRDRQGQKLICRLSIVYEQKRIDRKSRFFLIAFLSSAKNSNGSRRNSSSSSAITRKDHRQSTVVKTLTGSFSSIIFDDLQKDKRNQSDFLLINSSFRISVDQSKCLSLHFVLAVVHWVETSLQTESMIRQCTVSLRIVAAFRIRSFF